ncbi:MAG: hypothetical protein AAFY66_15075 [Pseudomonadota bacterium]
MLLGRTIAQLDTGPIPPEEAAELGQLGYIQWLSALPCGSNYTREAMHAYEAALPFRRASPAIAVFCGLLIASASEPPRPLSLDMPTRHRRGGAMARRLRRTAL